MAWEQHAARSIHFYAGIENGDGKRRWNGKGYVRKMIESYGQQVPPPTIESLADEFETSERSLRRYFRSALGMSAKTYLARLRATRIIVVIALHPEMTLEQVADRNGYLHTGNLRVALSRQFGIGPDDVREGPMGIFCAIDTHRDWVESWWETA